MGDSRSRGTRHLLQRCTFRVNVRCSYQRPPIRRDFGPDGSKTGSSHTPYHYFRHSNRAYRSGQPAMGRDLPFRHRKLLLSIGSGVLQRHAPRRLPPLKRRDGFRVRRGTGIHGIHCRAPSGQTFCGNRGAACGLSSHGVHVSNFRLTLFSLYQGSRPKTVSD